MFRGVCLHYVALDLLFYGRFVFRFWKLQLSLEVVLRLNILA